MQVLPEEKLLWQGIRKKAPQAQAEFEKRYGPELMRLFRCCFGLSPPDAEDLAQEVLCEVLMKPHRFDPRRGASLRSWILRVARNRAIDRVRRAAREPKMISLPHSLAVEPPAASLSGPKLALAEKLLAAFESLAPEEQRLLLWHLHGVRHRQIGEWTGKSVGAVRKAVSRVKQKLRRLVNLQEP